MAKQDQDPPEVLEDYEEYSVVTAETMWSFDDPGYDLTVEEQLFCRSYIIDRNPVAALRRLNYAGDSPALRRIANKFLAKVEVKDCVDTLAARMMAKLDVTAEKVQRKIASAAFFDPREVLRFDGHRMQVLDSKFWSEEQAAAIQSVKLGKDGVELKFYDRLRATEMLSKQLGTLPEESSEAAAARIAAQSVVDKLVGMIRRSYGDDNGPDEKVPNLLEDSSQNDVQPKPRPH